MKTRFQISFWTDFKKNPDAWQTGPLTTLHLESALSALQSPLSTLQKFLEPTNFSNFYRKLDIKMFGWKVEYGDWRVHSPNGESSEAKMGHLIALTGEWRVNLFVGSNTVINL